MTGHRLIPSFGSPHPLSYPPPQGDVWGVAGDEENLNFYSACSDGFVRCWDMVAHRLVGTGRAWGRGGRVTLRLTVSRPQVWKFPLEGEELTCIECTGSTRMLNKL